jgi:hypothetical protein
MKATLWPVVCLALMLLAPSPAANPDTIREQLKEA